MIPCMLTGQVYTTGDTTAELRTYKYKDITSDGCSARITLYYRFANNNAVVSLYNIVQLYPSHTNTTNLGSPSLQWNDTYTRHILIDNDINIWSSTINKTSNSGALALRGGTNHSDGASIGLYGKDYNSGYAGAIVLSAYGNSDYTILNVYPNGTMNVYNNSTNTTKNIAMQEDVNTLLSGKANSSHTHTTSDITDFPTIPTKTSDLTNDSGFLTSHQDLSDYIPKAGGSVLNATLLGRVDTDNIIRICGGTDNMGGASIQLNGKDTVGNKGVMFLVGYDGTSRNTLTIKPDGNITADNGVVTKNVAMREDAISEKASRTTAGDWTITGLIPYKPVYLKVYVTSNRINNASVNPFLVLAISNVYGLATINHNIIYYVPGGEGYTTSNKIIASFSAYVPQSETGTLSSAFVAFILPTSSSITIGLRNNHNSGNSIDLNSAYCYQ